MTKQIILASSSPRRQQILQQVNIPFTVRVEQVDESIIKTNDPQKKVAQLARLKNEHMTIQQESEIIITADTVVAYENNIFEKPSSKEEAFNMIHTLSGNVHDVFTGVMIRSHYDDILFVEQTQVEFWPLSEEMINNYVLTDEPYDKAGGYGIQSVGAMFVKKIVGDYYNVVGLPISRVIRKLHTFIY